MLINLAAAGVSPGFPAAVAMCRFSSTLSWEKCVYLVARSRYQWRCAIERTGGEILRRGANVMPVIRPLATGRWPAMQLTVVFPCPRVPVRQCTLPGVVQDRHSTANAGCRKSDLLPVNSTWTFSPYPGVRATERCCKTLAGKENSEKALNADTIGPRQRRGCTFPVPDAKGWCKSSKNRAALSG